MGQNGWSEFGWRPALAAVLVGWFLPVAALQAAVIFALFSLWAGRSEGRRRAGLLLGAALCMAAPAGLRLLLALPVSVEMT